MKKIDLIKYLDEAEDILNSNQIENDILQSRFSERKRNIDEFSAKILFVGGFSAGKSALLNSFLGDEEILRENISPETAIAAELVYGSPEKVVRVTETGEKFDCDLSEIENFSAADYYKYIYVLKNERLKKLGNLIPVDMPGFDSGIEAHTKALMQYIGDAAAYVFVVNLEKGTIGQSSLDFLDEIKEYSNSISFVLTKRDKLSQSDVEKVTKNIETTLSETFDKMPSVIVTSNRDSDCGEKLSKLLSKFSADELLLQKLGDKIIILLRQAIQSMKIQLESLDFNAHDLDIAIQSQERKKDSVIIALRREKKKLHDRLQMEVPNKILQDVELALKNQIGTLVYSAKQGSAAFNATVNNIIRPIILQSTQQNIETTFDEYVGAITNSNENNLPDPDSVADKMLGANAAIAKIAKSGKKLKGAYRVFSTGLALTTTVIAPWLELIIIFLPDIIGLLGNLIGKSKDEKIKQSIEYEIIPQICNKLRPEIRESLLKVEEERLAEIEEEFQTTLDTEISSLQQLKDEKDQRATDVSARKAELSAGIRRIEEIITAIENA